MLPPAPVGVVDSAEAPAGNVSLVAGGGPGKMPRHGVNVSDTPPAQRVELVQTAVLGSGRSPRRHIVQRVEVFRIREYGRHWRNQLQDRIRLADQES
jgi:hypothetical protein